MNYQKYFESIEFSREQTRQAMLDAERTLSEQSRVAEYFFADEERNRQRMLDLERTLSKQSRVAEHFFADEERNRQAMLDLERTLSDYERMRQSIESIETGREQTRQAMLETPRILSDPIQASQELQPIMNELMAILIEVREFTQEQKQRMLLEREEDEETIKERRYSKSERVKWHVVNTVLTLTPSLCHELIKLLSDGGQQFYLMEKIKDLTVEEILKVLEEIYKNIDGFLL